MLDRTHSINGFDYLKSMFVLFVSSIGESIKNNMSKMYKLPHCIRNAEMRRRQGSEDRMK